MKFQIDARVFEDLVSVAAQAISSKPMKPEYECVFVEVCMDEGIPAMTVMGRDSGMAIKKSTDNIQVDEEGEALIPAKTLLSFLKLMKGPVTVTVDSQFKATLKCGSKRTNLVGLDPDGESSAFDTVSAEEEHTVTMDGRTFERMVNSVSHCISVDQGRLILTGINFAFNAEEGRCEAVGLDGFRMAIARGAVETNESFSAVIPATIAKLISKVIGASENVSFRFSHGVVIVDDYVTSMELSLLSGEYMDYKKLVSNQGSGSMRVKTTVGAFLDAVKLAMVSVSGSQKCLIVMNLGDENSDSFQVSAMSDKSDALTQVSSATMGMMQNGANEIAFNGRYIEDALKAAQVYGDELELALNTPSAPMVMIPVDRDDFYQLVLPVRRT